MKTLQLTEEETKIYRLYSQGERIKNIAQKLNLSTKTISSKMKAVSLKMKSDNKIDTVCKLIKEKII